MKKYPDGQYPKFNIDESEANLRIVQLRSVGLFLAHSFEFQIQCVSNQVLPCVIGACVQLLISVDNYFCGVVSEIKFLKVYETDFFYEIRMQSPLSVLKKSIHQRIFTQKNIQEILSCVLQENGFRQHHIQFRLKKKYPKLSQVTQYHETDFAFFERLITQFGLIYHWDIHQKSFCFIVTDDSSSLETGLVKKLVFNQPDQLLPPQEHAFCFQKEQKLLLQYTHLRAVDDGWLIEPEAHLSQTRSQLGTFGYQEIFDSNPLSSQENAHLVDVRQKSFEKNRQVFRLLTHEADILLGSLVNVCFASDLSWNKLFRVIGVEYGYGKNFLEFSGETTNNFVLKLTLLPADHCYYRNFVEQESYGFIEAKVSGESDVDLDHEGRYLVKYSDTDHISQRIFNSSLFSGLQSGCHFPLHKGTRVVLCAQNGDIDQPVIAGIPSCLDGDNVVTANNRTQSQLRSFLGHSLLLENQEDREAMVISTASQQQKFGLYHDRSKPRIEWENREGSIQIEAAHDISSQADIDTQHRIANQYRGEAENRFECHAQKGDVFFEAKDEINIRFENGFSCYSNQLFSQAKQYIRIQSKHFLLHTVRHVDCFSSEVISQAQQDLNFVGNLEIQCGACYLSLINGVALIKAAMIYLLKA